MFYREVKDSLQRGCKENVYWENLLLEINSSKYAYNFSLRDVVVGLTKAVFEITNDAGGDDFYAKFKKVLIEIISKLTYNDNQINLDFGLLRKHLSKL